MPKYHVGKSLEVLMTAVYCVISVYSEIVANVAVIFGSCLTELALWSVQSSSFISVLDNVGQLVKHLLN